MAKEPMFKGTDKHGNKIWQIQVNTGVKIGGKYQRVTETVHGTKAQARARQREIETDVAQGVNVQGGKQAFDKYAQSWLSEKESTLAQRTFDGYRLAVARLCAILGNTPLEKINAPVVRKTLSDVRGMVKGRNGAPSESTIRTYYIVLGGILRQAANDDLIRCNPCPKVTAPKAEQGERRAMTAEQYVKLGAAISEATEAAYIAFAYKERHLKETGHQNKPRREIRGIHELSYLHVVRIAHATGMRPSEIFALQWRHVDFEEGCLHVMQATKNNRGDGSVKVTKSNAGKRDVYLTAEALDALRTWRSFQASCANSLGIEMGLGSWVVCSDAFTQVGHTNFTKWWNKWIASQGFAGWELYELRHTQVTLLIDGGADIKTVQTRAGHSSPSVTLGIYSHAVKESQKRAAMLLPGAK